MALPEDRWHIVRETVGDGRLSVIMPFYNLASSASRNVLKTAELFESHAVKTEIVTVDDGSSDSTARVLEEMAKIPFEHVSIIPVIMPSNGGKGAALRAGFEASSGEYVMLLDGDLDILPDKTPEFFSSMTASSADIVVGSKRHPRSSVQYPWHRRLVSWAYFWLVRIFMGLPITDTQTGMKLFKRDILGYSLSRMLVKAYAFDLELLSIASDYGAKIVEAPVVIKFGCKFGALKLSTVKTMAIDSLAVFYRLKIMRYYSKVEVPPKLSGDVKISVVIACPGGSAVLDECLAALSRQTYRNYEVIVLPDECIELPQTDCACGKMDCRVVATGKVRPAEKRNIGIAQAKGEVVAFIDDDAYPEQHWLEYAVRYFGDGSIGALGGPGVTPPTDSFMCKVGGRVYENILVSGNYRYRYMAGGVRRDVDDYPSCNLFVRTDLLRRINGYRTDFWPGEDTLLCKDIVDSGARIVYDPWVVVYHHRRPVFAPHLRQLGRYAFHRGYFCKKFPSNSLYFSYFVPTLFVLYLTAAVSAAAVCALSSPSALNDILFRISLAPLALYIALLAATSVSRNPLKWALVFAGVFLTHIVYGVRFVQGLAAKKAPCEFIGSDHAA